MLMMESDKQLKDFCSECKQDFAHGERVVLLQNLKFFHFFCYKKKNCFYRFFNSIKTFFIWQEASIILEELNATLRSNTQVNEVKDMQEKNEPQTKDNLAAGDATAEVHELQISPKISTKDVTEDEEIDIESIDESDNNLKGSIDMNDLENNLMTLMDEVGDMKNKINVFAAEKENDEKVIKRLEQIIIKYKKEVMELRWNNNYLEQKLLSQNSIPGKS